jgi:large subunit ribosomal protein L23
MPELHPYDVVRRAITSEKATLQAAEGSQFTFEVAPNANKVQIKEAVEIIFDLAGKVTSVRTMINPAKRGRRGRKQFIRSRQWKKAIVTLVAGEKIDLFNV